MSTPSRRTRLFALSATLLLTVIGTLPATAQTMEEAGAAYERGDYDAALRGYRRAAEHGNAEAQFSLGFMYYRGEGVPEDDTEAARWLGRSAEKGHARAQYILGIMYEYGKGVPQNDAEAARWYHRAAKWYRRRAAEQDAEAQYTLSLMYEYGRGVPQDTAEAVDWIILAAEEGHAEAQSDLGRRYRKGEGVPQDYAEAVKWLRRAAAQGDAAASSKLGFMYSLGEGVPQDNTEAVRWFRRAVEQCEQGGFCPSGALGMLDLMAGQGDADAQFNLGAMYLDGKGVPRDTAEAAKWTRRAAEQGHADAQFYLGLMSTDGLGVPRDSVEALRWFRRAAEQGHADAQFKLGFRYARGQGVPQDYAETVKWWRRAAEQGHADAQFYLGLMYADGEGVPQDYTEAVKWYRRAAEQGEVEAQFKLGLMYRYGEGVPQDYAEAAKWYRRAAEQGHAGAQNNLGLMYENGEDVVQNLVQAHKWYNLAVSRASSSEQELREKAVRNRDRAAARLAPAELAKAQRLAREWRPRWRPRKSTVQPPARERDLPESTAPTPETAASGAGDTGSRIANLQRALHRLGYDPGPVDGILGARTKSAIQAFQADAGLPVTGQLSERLESAVLAAIVAAGQAPAPKPAPPPRALERTLTGSGFRASARGHVLTNAHVVRGCTEVRIPPAGVVEVVAREDSSDLALLQVQAGKDHAVARFRQGRGIRQGASVLVAGYPLRGLVASGGNVSTGAVSALAGPGDDRRLIQITAPVQPGNSGGPVLDATGNVVGVVVATLDAIRIARSTGDIPQNVNFAVSAGTARAFLDGEDVPYETAPSDDAMEPVEVAAAAKKFTVLVECWK